jgi:hypothetical protein
VQRNAFATTPRGFAGSFDYSRLSTRTQPGVHPLFQLPAVANSHPGHPESFAGLGLAIVALVARMVKVQDCASADRSMPSIQQG